VITTMFIRQRHRHGTTREAVLLKFDGNILAPIANEFRPASRGHFRPIVLNKVCLEFVILLPYCCLTGQGQGGCNDEI